MKSNHIHSFLLAGFIGCFVTIAATSCRFEEDDYFNESASLRVEHTNDAVQKILADAPNGWVMQYFCGSGIAHFEGFNLFANFDKNGKVTLASNHRLLRDGNAGKYTESESLYSLLLEDGPVLAFNTWNDVLTPFVDPVNPWTAPNALYKDGAGMAGDHNFAIVSYKDNEILLRGERHSGNVRLTKCSVDWKDYIAQSEVMRDYVSSVSIPNYYVITETDTMYFLTEGSVGKQIEQGLRSGRVQLSERLTNPVQFDSLSCVFTPKGLRFEKPDTVGGHVFQELTLNSDSTALVNEDGTVRVYATWDYYLAQSTDIMWLDTLSMSEELKSLCTQLDAALTANNRNYSLARIGIGKTTNANNVTGLVVQWYTNTRKTSRNMGGLALKRSVSGSGQIAITCDENANIDNNMKARSEDVINVVRSIGAALAGTYNVTPDHYFVPAGAKFVSANGNTFFKLAKE